MLQIYQSHRLEILLELLATVIANPQDAALVPETVIVQSKGMGRWISLSLADRHGISANLRFPLPATFIWQLLCRAFPGLQSQSIHDPAIMQWRVMAWLSDETHLSSAPALGNYLANSTDLRRLELSRRIAETFDQYLVYRPDWIAAWQAGRQLDLGTDEDWQCRLWQWLTQDISEPHRAELLNRLASKLDEPAGKRLLPSRICLFGMSSMPPALLEVLRKLAQQIDVYLFAINPCCEAWGYIRDTREIARMAGDRDPEDLHLEVGHPLLAGLGKQGRDFFDALLAEQHHLVSLFDGRQPLSMSLLGHLQADILNLLDPRSIPKRVPAANDRSVQVHVCHSPMREIEVLKDQLLAMLDDDPTLTPAEIAVLAPDISAYAPFIEAVFGAHDPCTHIPYAIADAAEPAQRNLMDCFLGLLDLPHSRFEADEMLEWLEQPAIRQRFGIDELDLPTIYHWVSSAGIRWGRDERHRAELHLPSERRHTWRDGLNRLLLGVALPQCVALDGCPVFKETLPSDDVEGQSARLLGYLAEYIATLEEFADGLRQSRNPWDWADYLTQMLNRTVLTSENDDDSAIQELLGAIRALRENAQAAGFAGLIDVAAIKTFLTVQLDQTDHGGGFLSGGVTFATLVPMRCLPFKVICLLGMNDGALPRQRLPAGFDLIARHPRRGDRSRRLDDRYLFLETLLSVRQTLYLSYVGRNIRDNAVLPPSVLVADLLDVLNAAFEVPDGVRSLVTEHPLQPFNPRYFSGDPKYPSYARQWLASAEMAGKGSATSIPLFSDELPDDLDESIAIDLDELFYFFTNPARYLLRQRLGISLETADVQLENREPFDLDRWDQETIGLWVLEELEGQSSPRSAKAKAMASGLLPHGNYGTEWFDRIFGTIETLAPALEEAMRMGSKEPVPFELEAHGIRLSGLIRGLSDEGLMKWRLQPPSARELFHGWLEHLALCHARPAGVEPKTQFRFLDRWVRFSEVNDAKSELTVLIAHYRQGLRFPLPFFLKSAWQYCEANAQDPEGALKKAQQTWLPADFRSPRIFAESENPYYRLIYRGNSPINKRFETLALEILGPLFRHMN